MARVSVLITTFQHEAFIAEAIESVLDQRTQHDLEILIGEDASTDGTGAICDRYAAKDRRITVLHRPPGRKHRIDGHIIGRKNLVDLFRRATGDHATLLNGDDRWCDVQKIDRQVAALEADRACMGVYHHTLVIQANGEPAGRRFMERLPDRMELNDTIETVSPFHTSSFVFRNVALLKQLPPMAWRTANFDMMLFSLMAAQGHLLRVEGDMSCYRLHEGGITRGGIYSGTSLHRHRIGLWLDLVAYLNGRGKEKADVICERHLRALMDTAPPPRDASRWIGLMLRHPRFFLSRPHRWKMVLRAAMRGMV